MNDHLGKLDEMYICLLALSLLMFLPMLGWRLYKRRKLEAPGRRYACFLLLPLVLFVAAVAAPGGGDLEFCVVEAVFMLSMGMVSYFIAMSVSVPQSPRARDAVLGFFGVTALMALFGWYHLHYIYEPPRLPTINAASLVIEDAPGLAAEADGPRGRK